MVHRLFMCVLNELLKGISESLSLSYRPFFEHSETRQGSTRFVTGLRGTKGVPRKGARTSVDMRVRACKELGVERDRTGCYLRPPFLGTPPEFPLGLGGRCPSAAARVNIYIYIYIYIYAYVYIYIYIYIHIEREIYM